MTESMFLAQDDLRIIVEEVWTSLLTVAPDSDEPVEFFAEDWIAAGVEIRGCWDGQVVFETTREGALALASALFEIPPNRIEAADLADAVGEVANIVGGSIKSTLSGTAQLSLPWVTDSVEAPTGVSALQFKASWLHHPVRVSIMEQLPMKEAS